MLSPEALQVHGQIEEKAIGLALKSPASGNDGYFLLDYYGFAKSENYYAQWRDYQGRRILDVCAGLSDFTSRLLERGADAYALDYGYGDMGRFLSQTKGGWSANKILLTSVNDNPQRYIQGLSHSLPFPSGFFDALTSFYGLFGVADVDLNILETSVEEGIRVLKAEGVMKIGPFMGGRLSGQQKANQEKLLARLRQRNDLVLFERFPRKGFSQSADKLGQLTIQKIA